MTTSILDANGLPIGSFRDNQDPNSPQRYVSTPSNAAFVVPDGQDELQVLAQIPAAAFTPETVIAADGTTTQVDALASPWQPDAQAVVDQVLAAAGA